MAIILEGPDNSGKTTLAAALQKEYGWPIVHSGGPPIKGENNNDVRLRRDIDLMQQDVIMDRCHIISEAIYGPACRGKLIFDPRPWFRKMLALDMENEIYLVFCLPSNDFMMNPNHDIIIKPHKTQEHVNAVIRQKQELINSYRFYVQAFNQFMTCGTIDPVHQTDSFVKQVIFFMHKGEDSEIKNSH